uniref:Uncharacterized protein n=1 Tax=Oryza sativa subsp. japonica TaxID=39947 RepID=Q5ZA95_ORYSJ|nr:hypothetical protein [Oryza sativa Japonica Group]
MAAVAAAEQSAEQFRGQAKLLFLPVADAVPRLSSFRPPATDAATPGSDSSYPTPTSIPPPPTSLPSTPTPVAVWRTVASVDNASPPSRLRSGTPTALMPTAPLRLQIDAADAHHTHHQGYVFIKENKGKLEIRNSTVPISSRLYFECQQTYSCIMADITNKLLLPNYRRTIDDKLFQRKVPGGIMRGFFLMVLSSRRHFSYAGFEQQPKKFVSPKIRLLNIEQELKYEKENAEIRL